LELNDLENNRVRNKRDSRSLVKFRR